MAKKKSQIDHAVHAEAKKFEDLDKRSWMNPCGGTPKCGNAEALEDLFSAATAHWFAEQLQLPFQQVIYAPNRKIETKCGFDLSFGLFNSDKLRLRLQNKMAPKWCDVSNRIKLKATGGTKKPNRLYRQVGKLCSICKESNRVAYPYLLVQQCYCLHDYRRMGTVAAGVDVPPIDNPLRCMAIDLADTDFIDACQSEKTWTIVLESNPPQQKASCEVIFPTRKSIKLSVRKLSELVTQFAGA